MRLTDESEGRPLAIFVVHTVEGHWVGYVNTCPHNRSWLNIGSGQFFNKDGTYLECGRHGARFAVETGKCIEGPCEGESLEPISLIVSNGDVCLCGIALVEDDGIPDPFDFQEEETMDIMIHSD